MAGGDKSISSIVAPSCDNCYPASYSPCLDLPRNGRTCVLHELDGQQAEISAIRIEGRHLFC